MSSRFFGRILIKWLQGALEILTFFPIIFTIGVLLISREIWVWLSSVLLLHLVGLILGKVLLGKARYIYLGIGLVIALFVAWLVPYHIYTKGFIALLGFPMFVRGVHLRGRSWNSIFSISYLWIGLALYLLTGAIYSLAPNLKVYFPYLAWSGLSYMVIAFFVINFEKLKDASLPTDESIPKLPSAIIKNNRILVLLTMALVFIISYFNRLREIVTALFKGLIRLIVDIIVFLTNLLYQPTTGIDSPPDQGQMEILPTETVEPSLIAKILEMVAMGVALILLAILLWFGLRIILRKLIKLYQYLSNILKERLFFHEDTGFIDEKESLIDFVEVGREYMDRFQRWIQALMEREPKWGELKDNRQRIRFLYRHMILKNIKEGYPYKRHLTPRETGEDILKWEKGEEPLILDLTTTYDKIRYGQDNVEDGKVRELARKIIDLREG